MTAITLPPLPEPEFRFPHSIDKDGEAVFAGYYTLTQVEQIRRDAVRAALGAAVEACRNGRMSSFGRDPDHTTVNNNAILFAIAAIRALMPKDDAAERVAAAGGSGLPDLLAKFDGLPDVSGKVADVMPKEEGK